MSSSSSKSSFWFGPPIVDEAACGDFMAVKSLIKAGHDPNETNALGASALVVAAQYGHVEVVRMLFRNKEIDVNLQDDYGETALMKAANGGHLEVLKVLCKRRDIDVNLQDGTELTALMHAEDNHSSVKFLIKQKSLDISIRDENGHNAFLRACSEGWTKVVSVMLHSIRYVEQLTDDDLDEAECLARENGHEDLIEMVLKAKLTREKRNEVIG